MRTVISVLKALRLPIAVSCLTAIVGCGVVYVGDADAECTKESQTCSVTRINCEEGSIFDPTPDPECTVSIDNSSCWEICTLTCGHGVEARAIKYPDGTATIDDAWCKVWAIN